MRGPRKAAEARKRRSLEPLADEFRLMRLGRDQRYNCDRPDVCARHTAGEGECAIWRVARLLCARGCTAIGVYVQHLRASEVYL